MFDNKSDYAMNKDHPDTIVYASVTGFVRLHREDFASDEEFQRWKVLSDSDYYKLENDGRDFYDNCVSLEVLLNVAASDCSAEDKPIYVLEDTVAEAEARAEHLRQCAELLEQVKRRLTRKQYRRLYLHCVENMSEAKIAELEGVGQQRISKSITAAKKIVEKFFGPQSRKEGVK